MAATLASGSADALAEFCKLFPDVPERDAARFLAARKFDLAKAEAFLRSDLEWRAAYKPEEVTQEQLTRSLPSGCWRAVGTMKRTAPVGVLWIQLSLWNPGDYDVAEYVRLVVYFLEKLAGTCEQFTVLFDMAGWRVSHGLQLRKVHGLITTLQDHYPERLCAALLVRAPSIFAASWKMIKPMIDPVTAEKVFFLPKGDAETAALLKHIDAAVLPTAYGGELAAEATRVPGFPGEPDCPTKA